MGSIGRLSGAAGASVYGTQTALSEEDMDSDLLQEQTQSICEELQRRGACTTLALARYLGFDKSSCLNPLMFLLLEKNVVVRVSDIPPIWSLSPTFPMSPHFGSNQFPLSPQTPPLNFGFPSRISRVASPVQCSPALSTPTAIPSSPTFSTFTTTAITPVAAQTATPAPVGFPGSAVTCTLLSNVLISAPPTSVTPAVIEAGPSCGTTSIDTHAAVIPPPAPASVATPSLTRVSEPPCPVSPIISTPASVPDPTPVSASAPGPPSTSAASILDRSLSPAPGAVLSIPAMTFLEHVIPVPEDVSKEEDEVEVAVGKTSSITPALTCTFLEHVIPLPEEESEEEDEVEVTEGKVSSNTHVPVLTFSEHFVPESTEEKNVAVVSNSRPDIIPRLPVPALTYRAHVVPAPPPNAVVHGQHRHNRQDHLVGVKRGNDHSYRYFHGPAESDYQGSNTSCKRHKIASDVTEFKIRVLERLERGSTTTRS